MAVPRMSSMIASRDWSQSLTPCQQSSNKDDRSSREDRMTTFPAFFALFKRGCTEASGIFASGTEQEQIIPSWFISQQPGENIPGRRRNP